MPDDDKTNRNLRVCISESFVLCLLIWVLPLEADMLFGLQFQYGFLYLLLGHLLVTALILAPLFVALRRGVPARRLLSSLRVLFVLLMTGIWAAGMAFLFVQATERGTLLTPLSAR